MTLTELLPLVTGLHEEPHLHFGKWSISIRLGSFQCACVLLVFSSFYSMRSLEPHSKMLLLVSLNFIPESLQNCCWVGIKIKMPLLR